MVSFAWKTFRRDYLPLCDERLATKQEFSGTNVRPMFSQAMMHRYFSI